MDCCKQHLWSALHGRLFGFVNVGCIASLAVPNRIEPTHVWSMKKHYKKLASIKALPVPYWKQHFDTFFASKKLQINTCLKGILNGKDNLVSAVSWWSQLPAVYIIYVTIHCLFMFFTPQPPHHPRPLKNVILRSSFDGCNGKKKEVTLSIDCGETSKM